MFIDPSVENNLGVKTAKVNFEPLSPRIETVGYVAFDESTLWQTNVQRLSKHHLRGTGKRGVVDSVQVSTGSLSLRHPC